MTLLLQRWWTTIGIVLLVTLPLLESFFFSPRSQQQHRFRHHLPQQQQQLFEKTKIKSSDSKRTSKERGEQRVLLYNNNSPRFGAATAPSRRKILRSMFDVSKITTAFSVAMIDVPLPRSARAATIGENADPRSKVTVRLASPNAKLGLELYDVQIGNPKRTVPAIKRSSRQGEDLLQPGMILLEYPNSKAVVERIRTGPYPIELTFYNLAAGGDAFGGDMGKPIVSAQDALDLARQMGEDGDTSSSSSSSSTQQQQQQQYAKKVIKEASPSACRRIRSRRGDVLEINYEAHVNSIEGPVYDSSAQRGTGTLPYQFVLGSGDMITGVDLGLYEACPGEIRILEIPPSLAYGSKGNKLFRIPGDSKLVWEVEVVAINSIGEKENADNDEEFNKREEREL